MTPASGRQAGSFFVRVVDGFLAALAAGAGLVALVRRLLLPAGRPVGRSRTLLFFNSAYSIHRMRERGSLEMVMQRDLGGYFEHVWSVHPLVGASPDEPEQSSVGPPHVHRLGPRHAFVEGTVARFTSLRRLPHLNFVLAQAALLYRLHGVCRRGLTGAVRASDPYYNGLLALLFSRLHGLPLEIRINANHDRAYEITGALAFPRLFRWRWVEQRVARFTLSRADLVVTGSEDNERFAVQNGARPDRLGRLGNFSMISPIHLRDPQERPAIEAPSSLDGRPFLMCVSRLEPMKHPEDVLSVLAAARERIPELMGVVAGDGSMRPRLEQLRDELGLDQGLLLAGEQDQNWLASMLSAATVIVAPMAGLALVEAGLSATPIVAYDVEWHPDVLTHGSSALLVPYRDTAAMADAVCQLVEDPGLAAAIGRRAREEMLERMTGRSVLEEERAQAERLLTLHHQA